MAVRGFRYGARRCCVRWLSSPTAIVFFEYDDSERPGPGQVRQLPGNGASHDPRADDADIIRVHLDEFSDFPGKGQANGVADINPMRWPTAGQPDEYDGTNQESWESKA